jgi:hypothetical protein
MYEALLERRGGPMAYAVLMEFDVDLETHKKIGEAAGQEPIAGMLVHAAGPSDRGVYSLDVWESKDDADRFFAERLMPAMQGLGMEGGPPLSVQEWDLPFVVRG